MSFKTGDVVFLKSGSPPVVVEFVQDAMVQFAWMDPDGGPYRDKMHENCLTDVMPEYMKNTPDEDGDEPVEGDEWKRR